jgi:DDE superfamily endonuclease
VCDVGVIGGVSACHGAGRGVRCRGCGFDQKADLDKEPHVFTYSAICDVPGETLRYVTTLLWAYRREIGTRRGRRAGSERTQAKLVLRWFRDDASIRILAAEARLAVSTAYRYLHEGIDVIAEQAPDLNEVLKQAKLEGWSHVTLDGTLVHIDRVNERKDDGDHLWYSGKHKTQGGNVQILADPSGFPIWSSEVEPGSAHDIAAAREHCLGALYKLAADGVPTLADKGYEGAGIGVHTPIKGHGLHADNRSYNALLTGLRAIGERANAELKGRWRCLRRIRLCPTRIGTIVAAAIALSTLQRGNY